MGKPYVAFHVEPSPGSSRLCHMINRIKVLSFAYADRSNFIEQAETAAMQSCAAGD
jgi:hypothetical protein